MAKKKTKSAEQQREERNAVGRTREPNAWWYQLLLDNAKSRGIAEHEKYVDGLLESVGVKITLDAEVAGGKRFENYTDAAHSAACRAIFDKGDELRNQPADEATATKNAYQIALDNGQWTSENVLTIVEGNRRFFPEDDVQAILKEHEQKHPKDLKALAAMFSEKCFERTLEGDPEVAEEEDPKTVTTAEDLAPADSDATESTQTTTTGSKVVDLMESLGESMRQLREREEEERRVAQGIEHQSTKLGVAGSTPAAPESSSDLPPCKVCGRIFVSAEIGAGEPGHRDELYRHEDGTWCQMVDNIVIKGGPEQEPIDTEPEPEPEPEPEEEYDVQRCPDPEHDPNFSCLTCGYDPPAEEMDTEAPTSEAQPSSDVQAAESGATTSQMDSGSAATFEDNDFSSDTETGEVEDLPGILQALEWSEYPVLPDNPTEEEFRAFRAKCDQVADLIATCQERAARYKKQGERRAKKQTNRAAHYLSFAKPMFVQLGNRAISKVMSGKKKGKFSRRYMDLDSARVSFPALRGGWQIVKEDFRVSLEELLGRKQDMEARHEQLCHQEEVTREEEGELADLDILLNALDALPVTREITFETKKMQSYLKKWGEVLDRAGVNLDGVSLVAGSDFLSEVKIELRQPDEDGGEQEEGEDDEAA